MVCLVAIATAVLALPAFPAEDQELDFVEVSLLGILQKVAEEGKPDDPNLLIDRVFLKKVSDPTLYSNYHAYEATVFIKNDGRTLRNATTVLSGDKFQKDLVLKNSSDGFSLERGKTYIVDGYEVLFDGNYNGGTVTLNVDSNDFYELEFFELPALIEGIRVKNLAANGEVSISYRPSNFFLSTDVYEVFTSNSLDIGEADLNYRELSFHDKIRGYHVIRSSEDLLNDNSWKQTDKIMDGDFVYVRAVNPETGYYGVSDILKLSPQQEMSRAEFAKLFIDYAGIDVFDEGEMPFGDVRDDDWFTPYVQTLFNLGLVDHTDKFFFPNEKVTRGEVLVTIMDYFDVDLVVGPSKSRFEDISAGNFIYHYTQALFDGGKAGAFGDYFNQHLPATRNYLNHLVDAYK